MILHTLEFRHPEFRDEAGNTTAIRVVRDQVDLEAKLEASAPANGGETVRFVAMAFDLELPPVDVTPVPEIVVTLDNVSREIVRHLDAEVFDCWGLFLAVQRSRFGRDPHGIRQAADYSMPNVSDKVLRIIHSYTDYVNRVVWKKY